MFALFFGAALAAPPSSHLTGAEGTLDWAVTSSADGVMVRGRSPNWTVEHQAAADLSPRRTVRHDADGERVVVTYTATGAELQRGERIHTLKGKGLWDGDTVDVRLGAEVAARRTDQAFQVVDAGGGKLYSMDSALVAQDTCGASPCTHVRVQLTGLLRYVGPTWHYWYGADGELLRFEGPIGAYVAGGAQ
jgi:hypothetical protein